MRVLWLTSWYPNKLNPTNGDFIQRHAQATSLFCDVTVIHVEKDLNDITKKKVEVQTHRTGNLNETIVLYRSIKLFGLNKIFSVISYKKIFKQQVKKYILENGLPDVVHVQIAMKAGIIALWLKRKFGVPYVITDQWTMYNSTAIDAYENRNIFFKNFTKQIFKNASLFISVSKNLVDTIAKKIVTVPYKIVYNVVDTNNFFYIDNNDNLPFTFVHASTLKEQKNPTAIIDAFIIFNQQHSNSKLLMIGEAPQEVLSYCQQKKLPSNIIEFTCFIEYENLGSVVQQGNAFLLFSTRENMPCVVLEALCCGLPVVTSNAGGTAEVINKNNGIVVYDYNVTALADAMLQLYKDYNSYNKKSIAEASTAKFAYGVIGKQIADAYKQVLKNK